MVSRRDGTKKPDLSPRRIIVEKHPGKEVIDLVDTAVLQYMVPGMG